MILNTGISYYEQISWYMLMLCMCQSLPALLYLGLTPMFFKVASYCFIANFPGLTMPPKRKSVGEAVLSKRRKTTASTPVDTDVISMSPLPPLPVSINPLTMTSLPQPFCGNQNCLRCPPPSFNRVNIRLSTLKIIICLGTNHLNKPVLQGSEPSWTKFF